MAKEEEKEEHNDETEGGLETPRIVSCENNEEINSTRGNWAVYLLQKIEKKKKL